MKTMYSTYPIYSLISTPLIIQDVAVDTYDMPDTPKKSQQKYQILEQYFNDIYKLFLSKLAQFDAAPHISDQEKDKLKQLFNEVVHIKSLILDLGEDK